MINLDCEMIDELQLYEMVEKAFKPVTLVDEIIGLIEKKKGNYHQDGKNNNNYKDGISTYQGKKKSRCERCGGTKNLMVHHKDGNRSHNEASNLETLCWSCHEKLTPRKRNKK